MKETVIVTGGAVRVGKAIAQKLAEDGYAVVIQYLHSEQEAKATVAAIEHGGGRAKALQLNLEQTGDFQAFFAAAEQAFQFPVTGLVCSAARFDRESFLDTSSCQLHREFAVNTVAPYMLTQELVRSCEKRAQDASGSIVFITDAKLQRPSSCFSAYYASKGALEALTRSLARELAPALRVNAVAPGPVVPRPGVDDAYFAKQARKLPLKRTGEAADVARAVSFLMNAPFVTGEILRVDGGGSLL
ncbi:MAG: SDR family oxidoreductase [Spirochaetota bacterium]